VEGTKVVLQAARRARVPKFVYTSSTEALNFGGPVRGEEIDDMPYPAHPKTAYGVTKVLAEKLVLLAAADDFAVCILRPPKIWGPGEILFTRGFNKRGVVAPFKWPLFGPDPKFAMLHVRNAAYAHILAARALSPGSKNDRQCYNISDSAMNQWEYLEIFAKKRNLAYPRIRLPTFVVFWIAMFVEWILCLLELVGVHIELEFNPVAVSELGTVFNAFSFFSLLWMSCVS